MSAQLLYKMIKSKTEYPLHKAIKVEREDVVFLYLIEMDSQVLQLCVSGFHAFPPNYTSLVFLCNALQFLLSHYWHSLQCSISTSSLLRQSELSRSCFSEFFQPLPVAQFQSHSHFFRQLLQQNPSSRYQNLFQFSFAAVRNEHKPNVLEHHNVFLTVLWVGSPVQASTV